MINTIKQYLPLLYVCVLITVSFWTGQIWATKITIPIETSLESSNLVIVAKITSNEMIEKARRDSNGNWLPFRYRISASIDSILKCDLQNNIQFYCESLNFEEGKSFILFLKDKKIEIVDKYGKRNAMVFDFIDSPSMRTEATKKT